MAKIIIVDNQHYIQTLLTKELTQEGYQVLNLRFIELIWERIKNFCPDLVLLGIHSKNYDCWEIFRDIQRKIPGLPVLIYVIKSFDAINSLKQAINEVLDNKRFSLGNYLLPRNFLFDQNSDSLVP